MINWLVLKYLEVNISTVDIFFRKKKTTTFKEGEVSRKENCRAF